MENKMEKNEQDTPAFAYSLASLSNKRYFDTG